jgi:hypothetical protein
MKRIAVPMTFITFLGIVFVLGLASQSLWLLTPSFCMWTPGIFWLGHSVAKAGKFTLGFTPDEGTATSAKQHKQNQKTGQAYQ